MRISATANPVKVSYKAAGRFYNATGSEGNPTDSNNRTSAPFDEVTVAVGESFDVPAGAEIISVVQMGVTEAGGGSPADAGGTSGNTVNDGAVQ